MRKRRNQTEGGINETGRNPFATDTHDTPLILLPSVMDVFMSAGVHRGHQQS